MFFIFTTESEEALGRRGGEGRKTVADVVHGEKKMKTTPGHTVKEVDAAW